MFGTAAFSEPMFAEQAYRDMSVPVVGDTPWILQLRTSAGVLLCRLDGWFNADEQVRINQPNRLTFTMPLENPSVQSNDLVGPNEVWLFDGSHALVRKFIIQEERSLLDIKGSTYDVRAEGFLRQLADEKPNVGLSGVSTVGAAIDLILAGQDSTPPITRGFIVPSVSEATFDAGDANHRSLLALLNSVRTADIGGWFEVDNERSLNWYELSTAMPEGVFQLPSNLEGYEEKTRRKDVFNRIYATGGTAGSGFNKTNLQLPAPGYIEDTASQTTYGIRVKRLTVPWITTQAQLLAFATKFLADHKNPPVRRTLPAIDLSKLQFGPDSPSLIELGKPVILKPPSEIPGSPVPFAVNVVGYTRKLDTPLSVKVEFDEEEVDIFRMLAKAIGENSAITNVFNSDVEALWQALDGLTFDDIGGTPPGAEDFTDLGDTPGAFIGVGTLYQTNTTPDALTALAIGAAGAIIQANAAGTQLETLASGTEGQMLTPDSDETALEWVDFIRTSADKAALGTPAVPCFGLITTTGDNRLMFWDQEAADEGTPTTDDWRDVNSYGKAAT